MKKELLIKFKEAAAAVFPITAIVLLLSFTIVQISSYLLFSFLLGTLFLVIGMVFFTLGADISMMNIGEYIGSRLTRSRNIWFIALVCLILGMIVTIAEPDLRVLADTVSIVDTKLLIIAVAVGVGIFLVISFFRVYLQIKLAYILIIMYMILIGLALSPWIPNDFVAVAFDSGGVTTGPITVPFIMALGVGLASVRGDKTTQEDSFGLVALCSIGPILTVLILGAFNTPTVTNVMTHSAKVDLPTSELFNTYKSGVLVYAKEVAGALSPILFFFLLFNGLFLKLERTALFKIAIGMIYTYLGLVLFLTGANIGLMPTGSLIGKQIAQSSYTWILVPLGGIIGYFIVAAEPAVHVLKQQVEDITEGHITSTSMGYSLAIGVALSVALSMLRVITGLSIWMILIPGYLFSLIMTFWVPPLFTSIAFDSGGVASGPMTATFLLPLAMGSCEALGGNIFTDAFGIIAFVAMTPLVTIQLLGLISHIKAVKMSQISFQRCDIILSDEIIEYDIDEEV